MPSRLQDRTKYLFDPKQCLVLVKLSNVDILGSMDDAHARSADEVLTHFEVDATGGLSDEEAAKRLITYGRNEMPPDEGMAFWKLVLKQFDDLLVKILIASAIISFLLAIFDGESDTTAFVEPFVIILILIANATVGVVTENNAEKAIEELKAYQAELATVLRNRRLKVIPAAELVPGDVVEVTVGAKVPADVRITSILTTQLRCDQAILTGESGSVVKNVEQCPSTKAVVQDKTCLMFSGTVVTVGRARAVVVAHGTRTAIGQIHDHMKETTEELSPLKKKLDEFGTFLSKVIAVICILVWVVNIGNFHNPMHGGMMRGAIYYFKIAVALAVAAIPEGLPAVVTTCLALGTKKMAKYHAIVRSLPSVETLGCTTVICSDKTGTLTTNMMSVSKMCVVGSVDRAPCTIDYAVTGSTYAPEGVILEPGMDRKAVPHPADLPCLLHMGMIASLCNDSQVQYNQESGQYQKIGEATEVALRVLAEKVGLPGFDSMPHALTRLSKQDRVSYCNNYWEGQFTRLATLEFTRDRKMMSVLCTRKNQEILFVKGAPESVLAASTHVLCNDDNSAVPLSDVLRAQILDRVYDYGRRQTLRVLALALRPMPSGHQSLKLADETKLTFVGLVGMMDPPREEVKGAVETCRTAGIRLIVVTGDNKATAEAVCRRIGVLDSLDETVGAGKSFTGIEFDNLSEGERNEAVQSMALFSRVEPSHKSKLVELLKAQNQVVAMTGDGVNDAPALKKANIGVAMGSGTAVAKGASDMVLADDNFATIVKAVEEGRAIFSNTKQFIRYMVSSNIGEVVCIFLASALGMPETLVPVQLLWVNLVTDGLPATALGFNKPDSDIMMCRPRKVDEAIVNGWMFFRYLVIGVYVGLVTVGGYGWWYTMYEDGPMLTWAQLTSFSECVEGAQSYSCKIFSDRRASTISMSVLVVVEMFNALNALSENNSLLHTPPWSNLWLLAAITLSMILHICILYIPALAMIFLVAPLNLAEWKCVVYFSFPVILVDEVLKYASRRMRGRTISFRFWKRTDLLPRNIHFDSRSQ
ncbi:calcium-transporting ATPase [Cymbomonas tetramitiformis]|uniref:Calcium-transporting ATPase n=1 Tax=Cymbomonas tetramitiformis TaxID=36881 RepID=A0AAE0BDQ7_9CHLO|nr:calcium-transporting ATPase [Cymbomonas tetramitiformis]